MTKPAIEPIVGERVRLRMLAESDLPLTLSWRNEDRVRQWFFHSNIISSTEHMAWFEGYQNRSNDYVFVIEQLPSLRPVGQIALYQIDWTRRRAEFGRLMIGCMQAIGQGSATEAAALLVDEAFDRWGLHEVYLEVRKDNVKARAVYTRCGFVDSSERAGVIVMRKYRCSEAGSL